MISDKFREAFFVAETPLVAVIEKSDDEERASCEIRIVC